MADCGDRNSPAVRRTLRGITGCVFCGINVAGGVARGCARVHVRTACRAERKDRDTRAPACRHCASSCTRAPASRYCASSCTRPSACRNCASSCARARGATSRRPAPRRRPPRSMSQRRPRAHRQHLPRLRPQQVPHPPLERRLPVTPGTAGRFSRSAKHVTRLSPARTCSALRSPVWLGANPQLSPATTYSAAMKQADLVWDPANLDAYLHGSAG